MIDGSFTVVDLMQGGSSIVLRVAEYDFPLLVKVLTHQASGDPDKLAQARAFSWRVLDKMDLETTRDNGETPFYFWLRTMKLKNKLSFEDGTYNIPDRLAAAIVENETAKVFVDLIGGME